MKKYSLLMGLMCAALSITSCSKDNTETFDKPKGYEFELYAAPQTRTEVDGLDMKWSANDAMNVFHAPTGTTNYSSNDQFTVSDIAGGVFKGTITDTEFDPNGTYDWYAVYPYSKYMASPAESNSGSYFVVGSKNINTQQQTGIDNQAHICGENIPLYGKATGVTESPRLEMHHIATLFRINVANTGSADLNVTGITLTSASENLIGSYYFDITGETPVLTPYRDDYVSKTATLNITDGVVAPDATGSFYLATRAFTAPEGEQLTLTVTANGETVEKVATLSKETTFAAGKINKLNVDIAAEAYIPTEYAIITNPADIDVTATYFIGGNNEETVAVSPTMHMFTGSVVTGSNDWRLVTKEYTFDSSTNTFNDITGIAPVTLENAGVENTYYIKVGENYLCNISTGTTSGEKGLALQPTDPTAWTFETDTKKEGIYASSTLNGKKYILSCNGSSDALRLYGNTKYNGIYFFTEAGTPKTALDAPTNVETVLEDANTVYVGWDAVQGAASYTVSFEPATIEPQTIESTGEAYYTQRFTLDYATEYTVSVVANPADTENYKASAPATATFTTGENPNVTYTQIKDLVKGETVAIKDALVVATSTRGPILWDETGAILAYQPSETPAIGSVVTVNATVGEYNKALQLNDATFTVTGTTEVPTQTATEVTAANIDDLMTVESVTATYVKFTGILNISGSYYNVVFPFETNYQGSLYYPDAEVLGLAALNGREVNVEGWFTSITTYSGSPKYLNVVATQVSSASEAPYITADETASFVAAGETKMISFLTDNLGSNQVFAAISGDGAGQFSVGQISAESIPVTAAENTETTAKTATLTLYIAASEGGEHLDEAIVELTQAGVPSGEGLEPGTILYEETFGTTAVSPFSSYTGTGSSTYENASILTYTCKSNNTKIMADKQQACDVANLMVGGKNGGAGEWAKIGGIKTYNATSVTVTWTANNAKTTVSIEESSSAAVESANSESNTATFALNGTEETITLVITTPTKYNGRVDSFKIVYNN